MKISIRLLQFNRFHFWICVEKYSAG